MSSNVMYMMLLRMMYMMYLRVKHMMCPRVYYLTSSLEWLRFESKMILVQNVMILH